jgi:hypothetical protein
LAGGLIVPGAGLTVNTTALAQPVVVKRKEMVAVPADIALTTPPKPDTVATEVLLLNHAPEVDVVDKVVVVPGQADNEPVIAEGNGFTVTTAVRTQPVTGAVYDIVAVPAAIPSMVPVVATGTSATAMLPLLHVPPVVAELSVVLLPGHVMNVPVIVAG